MKKIYILFVFTIAGLAAANAQRSVDWSLDEIFEPSEITSSAANGTTVDFTFVLKNLGTDSCIAGDTVLAQMAIFNSQGTALAVAPSATTFYFDVLTKTVKTGDTVHFKRSANFSLYPISSLNVTMVGVSYIRNRTNAITNETSPGTDNNRKEKDMVWYNPQGWGVSIAEVGQKNIFSAYPNPATDVLNLEWQMATSGDDAVSVRIYSIDGKLVKTEILDGFGRGQVSVNDLESGMYFVEFESGSIKSTETIQVNN